MERRDSVQAALPGGAEVDAARSGRVAGRDRARLCYLGQRRPRPDRVDGGQSTIVLPGSAIPRQEAGNRAKIGISDAINACPAFGKIRKNNQLVLEA